MSLIDWKLYFTLRTLLDREEGQDLVEYALILTVFGLAAIAGMHTVANAVNLSFTQLGSLMGSNT